MKKAGSKERSKELARVKGLRTKGRVHCTDSKTNSGYVICDFGLYKIN